MPQTASQQSWHTRGPFEAWLRAEFGKNTPFDQMTKAVLTAKGDTATAGPAAFYGAVGNNPERIAEAVSRGLADTLTSLVVEEGPASVRRTPLWSRSWILVALLTLLGADWFYRRWLGLA
jgi:hypothetical protein